MDGADSEELKHFERRFERQLGLAGRWRLRYNLSKLWLRGLLYTIWYVLLAAAGASAIYHLSTS